MLHGSLTYIRSITGRDIWAPRHIVEKILDNAIENGNEARAEEIFEALTNPETNMERW